MARYFTISLSCLRINVTHLAKITSLVILELGLIVAILSCAQPARAANPNLINFQGKVVNSNGTNVADGTYNFDFIFYDDPTLGTPSDGVRDKWHELTKSVTVTAGVFQTSLGSATTLPDFNANPNLYLAIRFNADAQGYMTPRVQLTSVPYALNSDNLGGVTKAGFVQLAQGVQTDASSTNPSIYINKTATTADILKLQRATTDVFLINNNGTATLQSQGNTTTLAIKQTASATTTADIFNVLGANGSTKFISVTPTAANAGALTLQSFGAGNAVTVTAAGALNLTGAAASTWSVGAGNALTLTSSSIQVTSAGVLSVLGAQSKDITTIAAGSALTIQPADLTTASSTGGILAIKGGNETGTNSTGGNVTIDAGTGTSANGSILLQQNGGNVGIGISSPTAKLQVANGSLLVIGTYGGGNGITTTGTGTRAFFDTNKGAFRAGRAINTVWDNANVGDFSVAFGDGNSASGASSISAGLGNTASGDYSVALGISSLSSGARSVAIGDNADAIGASSISLGAYGTATGDYSSSLGYNSTAQSYASTVVGSYNLIQGTSNSWVATDDLFVVGNGTSAVSRSNAFSILKNGNVGIGSASPASLLSVGATNQFQVSSTGTVLAQSVTVPVANGLVLGTASSSSGGILFNGSAGGTITVQAPTATITNYTIKLPTTQGAVSTFLQNDGAGNLSWSGGAGCSSCITQAPTTTAQNTITPTAASIGALTVNGTSGTAATALAVNNQGGAAAIAVTATSAPTVDQVTISNAGQAVATNGVSSLKVTYVGGTGAIEGSGMRVDFTPGGTSGATWSGLRIVANATGAASGVNQNGLKLEGPTTPGLGTETGVKLTTGWDIGIDIGSGGLQLAIQSEPATPAADNLRVYARKIAGRVFLAQKGPSGLESVVQPSLAQNQWAIYSPGNTATTIQALNGLSPIVTATLSQPAADQVYGYMTNFASGAISGNESGFIGAASQWVRGSTPGASGFFYFTRIGTVDTALARIFVGLTDQTTLATVMGSDNFAGHRAGFQYSTVRVDSSWQFNMKDGTTQNLINTSMAVAASKVYDMYIFTAPQGGTVFWRIDNLTDNTTQEGSSSTNMPGNATFLRPAIGIETQTAGIKNLRMQRMYIESDR